MLAKIDFGKPTAVKSVMILVPNKELKHNLLLQYYVKPLVALGVKQSEIVVYNLEHNAKGRATAAMVKEYLAKLEKLVKYHKPTTILVADSTYFKKICAVTKSDRYLGSARVTLWQNTYGFILPNFRQLFHNPLIQNKIDMALDAAADHINGGYGIFPTETVTDVCYPTTQKQIKKELDKLSKIDKLTCDIETEGLQLTDKLYSIAFSKDKHSGVSFLIQSTATQNSLRLFFLAYTGKLIFHSATFDTKMLIYHLFMDHARDIKGMLQGLDCLYRNLEDTKILGYLALNSAGGNTLSLKELAFPYLGDYGLEQSEITNIKDMPVKDALKYNIDDTAATWYVYTKYRAAVMATQKSAYQDVFLPALKVITQMELVGMPMDMDQVKIADVALSKIRNDNLAAVLAHPITIKFTKALRELAATAANKKLVKLVKTEKDFPDLEFNPGSSKQLGYLLYTYLQLPVTATTPTGAPSCDSKALAAAFVIGGLEPAVKSLLGHIQEYLGVKGICDTFIPAFHKYNIKGGNWSYLHGSFVLGGTKSSRLSSCLIGETSVQCTTGIKALNTITKLDKVLTHMGSYQQVLNVFDNGVQDVFKVTLQNSYTITCTENHRILTTKGFLSLKDMQSDRADNQSNAAEQEDGNIKNVQRYITNVFNKRNSTALWRNSKGTPAINCSMGARRRNTKKTRSLYLRKKTSHTQQTDGRCRRKISRIVQRSREPYAYGGYAKNRKNALPRYERNITKTLYSRADKKPTNFGAESCYVPSKCYERENWKSAPQFQRSDFRRQRVFTNIKARLVHRKTREQPHISTPSSNVQTFRIDSNAPWVCCTPCGPRQDQQPYRQSGITNQCGTYTATRQIKSRIKSVHHMGTARVYDLEIKTDHCYLANGIFVHNSRPNMQNLPSTGTIYAKAIKQSFRTPPSIALSDNKYGWLMVGADFNALESVIMALLTKDPNMLKVFTDGYCGHCLRAYRYYGHLMTGINPDSVESINSIKQLYPDFRQASKGVSFALQYMGTWRTLMKNFGLPKDEAIHIEAEYHKMYYVADEWVMDRIRQAGIDGYIELAFGVRLRTPMLPQIIIDNHDLLPYMAYQELKTAANALGQSYGLLNTRAANEFMGRVWESEYAERILPISQIHDSQYYMIENTIQCLEWVNTNLIDCMRWNKLPAIQHPTIQLGAELEVYYPTWANKHIIPNDLTRAQILDITQHIK